MAIIEYSKLGMIKNDKEAKELVDIIIERVINEGNKDYSVRTSTINVFNYFIEAIKTKRIKESDVKFKINDNLIKYNDLDDVIIQIKKFIKESEKNLWDMTIQEISEDRLVYLNKIESLNTKPSEDMLNQYLIMQKLEEIKELIKNRDKFYFSHREGIRQKLNQINKMIP